MALFNKKSTLVSVAVLALLTSCGKSKEAKNPSPQPINTAPTTIQTSGQPSGQAPDQAQPTTATQTQQLPAPTKLPGQSVQTQPVPAQQSASAQDELNTISKDPLVSSNGQSDLNNDQGEILSPLPVAPAADESNSIESSVIRPPLKLAEKSNGSAKTVDFNQAAVRTGGRMGELYYTSAGNDGLMDEFKSYNNKVSKEQQTMNLNLSKNIIVAKLSRQKSSGLVIIDLTVDEFGKAKTYRLMGSSVGDRFQIDEDANGGRGDLEFQGGFLKCLDRDGGCENAYAKLKFSGAYTRIIFRNSYSDMHFLIQRNITANSGFEMLNRYVQNTIRGTGGSQKIDSLQVSSFEVVNGRAGMGALLTTTDKEMVGLSIPLVVNANGSQVSIPATKLTDLSKNYDLSSVANSYSQRLTQQISAVKLVNNNGRGQLKLKFEFTNSANPGYIWMQTSRVQKPVLSLEEIRTFESKVKFF